MDEKELFAALEHGAPPLPTMLPVGAEVIAAAGVWGDFGSVVVLRRDEHDLLDDVYLLTRSPDGRWQAPDGSSGSGMPEWLLDRPDGPLPGPRPSDVMNVGAQVAWVAGHTVAELTVLVSRAVRTVEVEFGGAVITVPTPACGLITLPAVVRSISDFAEFKAFDDAGRLLAVELYRPLTENDIESGWWKLPLHRGEP